MGESLHWAEARLRAQGWEAGSGPTCHKTEAQAGTPVLWQVGTHIHPEGSGIVTVVATWPALSNLIIRTLGKGMSSPPGHRRFEK